jgi:hypothetical protein
MDGRSPTRSKATDERLDAPRGGYQPNLEMDRTDHSNRLTRDGAPTRAGRREPPPTSASDVSGPSARLRERISDRWDRLVERSGLAWARFTDRALRGAFRPADPATAARVYLAEGWSKWLLVLRRPAVIGVGILAALSIGSAVILIREAIPDSRTDERPDSSAVGSGAAPTEASVKGNVARVPTPSPSKGRLSGVEIHVNDVAGFLFSYPTEWVLETDAGADRLTDPSGDVVMTFEVAAPGTLESASDRLVEDITERYSDVDLEGGTLERTPQGLPSLLVSGHGITPGGATARFIVITVHGRDGNRAITVHFSPDARPLAALAVIREVIASYRIST